jgi:hypothetical protein
LPSLRGRHLKGDMSELPGVARRPPDARSAFPREISGVGGAGRQAGWLRVERRQTADRRLTKRGLFKLALDKRHRGGRIALLEAADDVKEDIPAGLALRLWSGGFEVSRDSARCPLPGAFDP